MDGLVELNLKPISRDIFSKHFPSPSAAATVPQVGKTYLLTSKDVSPKCKP